MFRNFVLGSGQNKFCVSVTAISSYSFEARGLKFGKKIHLINAVTFDQIFEFLSWS